MSGDLYLGDPQFLVFVDGQQIGSAHEIHAARAAGQWQEVTVDASVAPGAHTIEVRFINDAWGDGDRNLYVGWIDAGGTRIQGDDATDFVPGVNSYAGLNADTAALLTNSSLHYDWVLHG